MIRIGLTTWSEHDTLLYKANPSLSDYGTKLPLVEVDSPFYGIPSSLTTSKWVKETPDIFRFIVKGHQSMTGHSPWSQHFDSEKNLFETYFEALAPIIEAKKLEAILFQFPASFDCSEINIVYLKRLRQIFEGLPLVIELRNPTWYHPEFLHATIDFMKQQELVLMTVDEPQVPNKSVPFLPIITHQNKAILRLHGRNATHWATGGEDWRKKRTLYRYNHEELEMIAQTVRELAKEVGNVSVIFNNNSGGDAAANALSLKEMLGTVYEGLNPEQMNLF